MKSLSVPDKHLKNIALKTLRMPDAMVGVMGGMDKDQARNFLKEIGYSDNQIRKLEARQISSGVVVAGELLKIAKELTAYHFRSVPGDPRWITVKYSGHCHKCHKPIEKGEQAFYYPKGHYLFGEKCGCGKAAENDFTSHSEMDVFETPYGD
jgi:hypothetical protein